MNNYSHNNSKHNAHINIEAIHFQVIITITQTWPKYKVESVYIYLVKSILGGLTNFILFAFTIKSSIMLADCAKSHCLQS